MLLIYSVQHKLKSVKIQLKGHYLHQSPTVDVTNEVVEIHIRVSHLYTSSLPKMLAF
jgi:hypothetical protein